MKYSLVHQRLPLFNAHIYAMVSFFPVLIACVIWQREQQQQQQRKEGKNCKYKIERAYKMSRRQSCVLVNEYDVIAVMTIYK